MLAKNFQTHYCRAAAGLDRRPGARRLGGAQRLLPDRHHQRRTVNFDLMQETLACTNLGDIKTGDRVNIERAPPALAEIGSRHERPCAVHRRSDQVIDTPNNRTTTVPPCPTTTRAFCSPGLYRCGRMQPDHRCGARQRVLRAPDPGNPGAHHPGLARPGQRVNIEIDPQTQVIVDTVERLLVERGLIAGAESAQLYCFLSHSNALKVTVRAAPPAWGVFFMACKGPMQ